MLQVIVMEMSFQFMKNFNYLIVDAITRQAVVIDPAWQMEKVDQALADQQATLAGVLITHSHPDHINLAESLATKYQCPIWMSEKEIAVSGFRATGLVAINEAPFNVGNIAIQPLLTPGHTPGSTCYLIGDNLFTGDVLFAEGCGMCPDVPAAHEMFDSLERLKVYIKPFTRVFPGHCYGKPPGQEFSLLLKENLYLQFPCRNSFTAFRLRKGQSKAKMFDFH